MRNIQYLFLLVLIGFSSSSFAVGPYCNTHCKPTTPCDDICYLDGKELPISPAEHIGAAPPEPIKTTCGNYGICDYQPPTQYEDVIPDLDLAYWNNNSSRRANNNCYNYASNKVTNNFAQPGYAAGNWGFRYNRTCQGAINGANADQGITPVSSLCSLGAKETAMALVVWPGTDYHWYRRDSNERWSHKPGSTSATDRDNSGNLIFDPKLANRGYYSDFCGFYKTKSRDVVGASGAHQNKGTAVISGEFQSGTQESSASKVNGVYAEVLIFSGMPNPKVLLTPGSPLLANLQSMQSDMHSWALDQNQIMTEEFIESKLGYQGILIHDSTGQYLDMRSRVLIKGNAIRLQNVQDRRTQSHDVGNSNMEREILEKALNEQLIDEALFKLIRSSQ